MGTSTMLARCLALLAFVAAVSAGDTSSITGLATAIESGYRAMHDHALKLEQEWHKQQVAVQKKEEDLRQKYVDLDNEAADLDRQEQQKRANKYNEMRNAQLEYQKVVATCGRFVIRPLPLSATSTPSLCTVPVSWAPRSLILVSVLVSAPPHMATLGSLRLHQ